MAEKLSNFPKTVDLLNDHQIGYHSSGHSVHPAIFEFTDVKSFEEAYETSLIRETSHINPLTGAIEGSGGIRSLRNLFPKKQISAFRAPGYCWTPPHLCALKTLGINYDFTTDMSIEKISYNGITFYPFTIFLNNWNGGIHEHLSLQRQVLRRETTVLTIHPSKMVNQEDWDLIYYSKFNGYQRNPAKLYAYPARKPHEVAVLFRKFDLLLRHLKTLQNMCFLKVASEPTASSRSFCPTPKDAEKCYKLSVIWAEGFGYNPKFLHGHFMRYFEPSFMNGASCSIKVV
jgi:hypothetical protein